MKDLLIGVLSGIALCLSVFWVAIVGYDAIILEQKCKENNGTVVRYTCIKNTAIVEIR